MFSIPALLAILLLSPAPAGAADLSGSQTVRVRGAHAELECVACHGDVADTGAEDRLRTEALGRCQNCHPQTVGVLHGPMATRAAEREFVERTWGRPAPGFFAANCNQCHVQDCLDCHGLDGHSIARPQKDDCHACHRGYYVGADYYGMAPREDALRYQRGPSYGGEHYLKMAPDVHARAGLSCGDCHGMASLAGQEPAKTCRDCHDPNPGVIEHGIAAHREKLECYACHVGWAPQEYGTFFIRLEQSSVGRHFRVRRDRTADNYVRSAYLRRQDLPPLGVNEAGRISPIRPQFQAYFTEIEEDRPVGEENRLLGAEWKAFVPHTVQRGTVMCDGCHGNAARFLLQEDEDRIYEIDRDGLSLQSFWNREGQTVRNGTFYDPQRFAEMSRKSSAYRRAYVEKWKSLVNRVDASSEP